MAGQREPVFRILIGSPSPTGGRFLAAEINGPFGDGGEQAKANAALIVARVNGWDALVAERDALREALEVIRDGADICRNTGATPAEAAFFSDRARAALGKGGAS